MPISTLAHPALYRRLLIAAAIFSAAPLACSDSAGTGAGGSESGGGGEAGSGGDANAGGADGGRSGTGGGATGGASSGGAGGTGGGASSTEASGGGGGGSGGSGGSTGIPGRALVVDGRARRADVVRRGGEAWQPANALGPNVEDLSARERDQLARAWASDGAYEHASVASFAKVALELMAFGAPAHLVAGAHRAALDEIEHASLAFSLASAYAGTTLEPGALPEAMSVAIVSTIEELVGATVIEGCVGETLAALAASAQRAVATDPAVRRALDVIAEDEARHAELAYATVAWAVAAFGELARAAARAALERAVAAELALVRTFDGAIHVHGRLSGDEVAAERAAALAAVVRPALERLLGDGSPEPLEA